MKNKKFELIITTNGVQHIVHVDSKPILFGSSSNCDFVLGSSAPDIKAVIQLENNVLNFKVFDKDYPVLINEKSYKSAKISKSMFVTIANIDIIISVEEVEISLELPDVALELPDFDDLEFIDCEESETSVVEVEDRAPEIPGMGVSNFHSDKFEFNIHFNENEMTTRIEPSFIPRGFDFSHYIDLEDETVKKIPSPSIEKKSSGRSIFVSYQSNGVTINERFFKESKKRIFISNVNDSANTFQFHDTKQRKEEFIFCKENRVYVICLEGYSFQRVVDGKLYAINEKSYQLAEKQKLVMSSGQNQIYIYFNQDPPELITERIIDIEEDVVKCVASFWSLFIVVLLIVVGFKTEEQKIIKNKVVKIYKKTKEVEAVVVDASSSMSEKIAKIQEDVKAESAPKLETKVVDKPTTKVPEVKSADVKPQVTKVIKKVAKQNIRKTINSKKVVAAKAPAKEKYKFDFSKKMNSLLGSADEKNLKDLSESKDISLSSINSSSNINSNFNSSNIGKANSKIARFAAGEVTSKNTGTGTQGLSNKKGSSTEYLNANTKVLGAIDPELVRKLMRERISEFRHCYQRELIANTNAVGVFDLEFQINANGKGTNVKVKKVGGGFTSNAINCLAKVVSFIRFPKPKGGGTVDIKQPMNFYQQ